MPTVTTSSTSRRDSTGPTGRSILPTWFISGFEWGQYAGFLHLRLISTDPAMLRRYLPASRGPGHIAVVEPRRGRHRSD